jgi:hypothetical protein
VAKSVTDGQDNPVASASIWTLPFHVPLMNAPLPDGVTTRGPLLLAALKVTAAL